jgi:hypothetical protein
MEPVAATVQPIALAGHLDSHETTAVAEGVADTRKTGV